MYQHSKRPRLLCAMIAAVATISISGLSAPLQAQKKGGGGGDTSAYLVVELFGIRGISQVDRISETNRDGMTYATGQYDGLATNTCLWAVAANGTYTIVDLKDSLTDIGGVNSVGMTIGMSPEGGALRLVNGTIVLIGGQPYAMTEPSSAGIVLIVGRYIGADGFLRGGMWLVDLSGDILDTLDVEAATGLSYFPTVVNNHGDAAGYARFPGDSDYVPAESRWIDGELYVRRLADPELDSIPTITGINDLGSVCGHANEIIDPSTPGVSYQHGLLWANGAVLDISLQTGVKTTRAEGTAAVNGTIQVVGRGQYRGGNTEQFAFLFKNGQMFDLNQSIAKGPNLQHATDVNNAGVISGWGVFGSRTARRYQGFLLLPANR